MRILRSHAEHIRKMMVITCFAIAMCSPGTIYPMHVLNMGTGNPPDSLLIDKDGNKYPIKKMLDNNLWMTTNLKLNIPDSYCYENAKSNCDQYGRLYTWVSAQKGCSLLGDGWRLPTMEEWRNLAKSYIKFPEDSAEGRKAAYSALLSGGSSPFNAVLGGGRGDNNSFWRLDAHGFYWTLTETNSITAGFINFGKGSQSLYRQNDGEKTDAFSVRCVKSTSVH